MSQPSSTSVFNEINAATCAALCLISLESLFMDCIKNQLYISSNNYNTIALVNNEFV